MSGTDPGYTTDPGDLELDWLSLDDDEEILWAGGPDRRTLIPVFLVGIPLAIILIGVVIIVAEYLRITNTHYVVTNRGLYRKSGILSRDVKRVDFEKVQNISYSQSAFGAHFGYGTVEISTAGSAGVELEFASIPEPQHVHRLVSDRTKRGRDDGEDGRGKDDVLESILVELQAIRSAVEGGDQSAVVGEHGDGGSGLHRSSTDDVTRSTRTDE